MTQHKQRHPYIYIAAAAALASIFLDPCLFELCGIIEWRRPVQDWMTAHGMGSIAPHYALVNTNISSAILGLIGGIIIGIVGKDHWFRLAALYIAAYVAAPWFWCFVTRTPGIFDDIHVIWRIVAYSLGAVAPATFLAAWFASNPLRRRQIARAAAGRCPTCAYDLTGNTTGVCTECGTEIKTGPN